jgi:dihydropyrimidinase
LQGIPFGNGDSRQTQLPLLPFPIPDQAVGNSSRTTIYLPATAQKYQPQGVGVWIGGPPLRDRWDQDMLWDGIRRGVIDTIGSAFKAAKLDPMQTIIDKRIGINNLQDYPPMMFSEGVGKGRITLEQFVAVTSTNAAKIFDMYPRKGVVQVGSDADIVR